MRFLILLCTCAAITLGLYLHNASATPELSGPPDQQLAQAVQSQVGVTLLYDPRYVGLEYPMGDIPRARGVCTDVVIRAMRDAWGIDLQQAAHKDMKAHFAAYPTNWGLTTTDRNIDHRRVPNLETLFKRAGASLPLSSDPAAFQTGDIVSFHMSGSNLPYIGIISEQSARDGTPLFTHNIGWGTRTDNMLFDHKITGHFRLNDAARDWLSSR